MNIHAWLTGQEFGAHYQWSITVYGDMDAFVDAMKDYPVELNFYRGHNTGYVCFGIHQEWKDGSPDALKASQRLWSFIETLLANKTISAMTGWHNSSFVTIGKIA